MSESSRQTITTHDSSVASGEPSEFGKFAAQLLSRCDHPVVVEDRFGNRYRLGGDKPHWRNQPFIIAFRTEVAEKTMMRMNPLAIADLIVEGQIGVSGNLYTMPDIYTNLDMQTVSLWRSLPGTLRSLAFQSMGRSKVNVKSHYDVEQKALDVYLDKVYRSYSCAMFEDPHRLDVGELCRVGRGQSDDFDSLEKAQWRKFRDAVDFVDPKPGETLLDVGCGYGGQLKVALESHPFSKVVGWTHSTNQVIEGRELLSEFPDDRYELNEGDYREDDRTYDHITSTGMISHVGRRGLVPYVRNIRRSIKKGGRYVHHAIMTAWHKKPMDQYVGTIINRKYVWPGFHWFTIGEHVKVLEENGFFVMKAVNLSPHYAKTTAAWNERMVQQEDVMRENLGDQTYHAWQLYLAGSCSSFNVMGMQVFRVYCVAK